MSNIASLFVLSLALAAGPACAAAAEAPPADDATIVVTASGAEQKASEVGQAISVVTADEIRQRQSVAVSDLLATVPGVTVSRNGGIGGTTTLRIRGAEGEQTLVLIDGVRVNDPASPGGAFDFSSLLTGNIDRIEVLRGPNSVIWGSQAIGGVVDIRTIEPGDDLAVNARAEYGHRDQAQLVGNVSGTFGPVAASVGGGWFRTDGVSAYAPGVEKDAYRNYAANAKFRIALTDAVNIDLRGTYFDGKADQDGFAPPTFAFGDTPEYAKSRQYTGYAGLNASFLDGRFRNRIAFTYTDIDRKNLDPNSVPEATFTAKGRIERYEYQGVLDLADPVQLVFGAEHEKSRLRSTSIFAFAPTLGRTNIDSVYGQAILKPFTGLTLTGGLRHDDHKLFGGKTTLGANFAYTPNGGSTVLRGTYAEGFKAPTLYQLQSEYGNVLLRPEVARSYDIGVEQHLLEDAVIGSVTYFRRRTRNQIDFVSCFSPPLPAICATQNAPFSGGIYDNIARARAEGAEFTLLIKPVEALEVRANYSYIDTENRSPGNANFGNRLARRPKQTMSVLADYEFPFGLSLGSTILHVGDSFNNAANTQRLDGYVLVDVRAAFAVTDRIELFGRVENLFDEQYRTVTDYGTIGRAAYAGVRLSY